jgi:hypothetical protein
MAERLAITGIERVPIPHVELPVTGAATPRTTGPAERVGPGTVAKPVLRPPASKHSRLTEALTKIHVGAASESYVLDHCSDLTVTDLRRSVRRFERGGVPHLAALCRELVEPMTRGQRLAQAYTRRGAAMSEANAADEREN